MILFYFNLDDDVIIKIFNSSRIVAGTGRRGPMAGRRRRRIVGRWLNGGGGGGKVERHKKAPLACRLTSTRLLLPAGDYELYCEDTHWSLAVRQVGMNSLPPNSLDIDSPAHPCGRLRAILRGHSLVSRFFPPTSPVWRFCTLCAHAYDSTARRTTDRLFL